MSRLAAGPFNRAEGNLEIKLDAGDAAVAVACVNSPLFRGFEQILLTKPPVDTMAYAPHICSHCSVSQSIAAAHALAKAQGLASIPSSRQNPKILWVDDAEVVRDRIAQIRPVLGDFLA
jgi:Ni,Fe-hydrogenase I large subunit